MVPFGATRSRRLSKSVLVGLQLPPPVLIPAHYRNTRNAHPKRSRVMKPLDYDIQEEHNSETKQMDMVLMYNGTSPSQTIRIPMHEAITIMMEWLSGYSQAYPMLLKMNPAYEEFAAKMQRLQDK